LTIEFTRTHQRDNRWKRGADLRLCFVHFFRRSSIAPQVSTSSFKGDLLRYSKDTQHCNQRTDQRLPGRRAAQPCSYIYPIYSVVKNR